MNKDEIKKALTCCKGECCSYCPRWCEKGCQSRTLSDALILITEQEKEIERLKEQIEELRNEKWGAQDDLDCYYDEMPSKIKQAKIDVLNELKQKCKFDGHTVAVYKNDIDKMIKEYE